jgi:hypothetical protein
MRKQPDFARKLAHVIVLTDGPQSRLVTLFDAAILIRNLEPFRQARPVPTRLWPRPSQSKSNGNHRGILEKPIMSGRSARGGIQTSRWQAR